MAGERGARVSELGRRGLRSERRGTLSSDARKETIAWWEWPVLALMGLGWLLYVGMAVLIVALGVYALIDPSDMTKLVKEALR